MKNSLNKAPARRRYVPPQQPANLADDNVPRRGPDDSPDPARKPSGSQAGDIEAGLQKVVTETASPPQNPGALWALVCLRYKLAEQVPSLRAVLAEIKTVDDWHEHEDEIALGIAHRIQDHLDLLQQERQFFCQIGSSFSEKVKAALQTDQPYWVTIRDEADETYRSQIVMANSREAATEAVIKEANDEDGNGPDDESGFHPVNASNCDELRCMIQQMNDAEAAYYRPPRRRKTPGLDAQLPDNPPLTARKGTQGPTIAERLAKRPQRKP